MLLTARACKRGRLPPVEFLLSWGDNPHRLITQNPPPVFGLVKTKKHADILFPNHVRRADARRDLNFTLNAFARTVSWEKKINKLFWRGSPMGVRKASDVKTNGRARLACAHRGPGPNYTQISDLIDAGFPAPSRWTPAWPPEHWRPLFERCRGDFVKPTDNEKYKYLVVVDGTGMTNRFKDYLTAPSLVIKNYQNPELYEFFEAGLQNAVNIFDTRNAELPELFNLIR